MLPEANRSSLAALWRVSAFVLTAATVYLSLSHTVIELPGDHSGRYAHVAAYGLLMVVFAQVYTSRVSSVLIAAGLLALGVTLEFMQQWGGYRNFERGDMAADAIGIALGWLFARTLWLAARACRTA